jgi:hypothetical protein
MIKTDQISKNAKTGIYTVYYYVVDEADQNVRLKETVVQGTTQEEIKTQLKAKYEKFLETVKDKSPLKILADTIAQEVIKEA